MEDQLEDQLEDKNNQMRPHMDLVKFDAALQRFKSVLLISVEFRRNFQGIGVARCQGAQMPNCHELRFFNVRYD